MTTNAEFARDDVHFRGACEKVGIEPSAAQARKWRSGRGIAYLFQHEKKLSRSEFEIFLSQSAGHKGGTVEVRN